MSQVTSPCERITSLTTENLSIFPEIIILQATTDANYRQLPDSPNTIIHAGDICSSPSYHDSWCNIIMNIIGYCLIQITDNCLIPARAAGRTITTTLNIRHTMRHHTPEIDLEVYLEQLLSKCSGGKPHPAKKP